MFVAVVPSDQAVADLDEFLAVRRDAAAYRWASAEQFHLTLAFLASVDEHRIDDLVARLTRAARKRTVFTTRLAGGGAFPHAARARVIWAGLELDDVGRIELGRMATGAKAAAGRAGVAVDGQRFRPHLTLARLGRPEDVSRWVRLLEGYAGPAFAVDQLHLVASYLGEGPRGRPRYEVVGSFTVGR